MKPLIKIPTGYQITGFRQPMGRREFKISTKRRALERSGGYCERCHKKLVKDNNKRFGVICEFDHVKNPINNSLNNCKVLCRDCHGKVTVITKRRWTNEMGIPVWRTIRRYSGIKVPKKKRRITKRRKIRKRNPYDFTNWEI